MKGIRVIAFAVLLLVGCDSEKRGEPSRDSSPKESANQEKELAGLSASEREFVERAGEICRASFQRRGRARVATDAQGVAQVAGALLPVYRYRRKELGKLEPPEDKVKLYRALLKQIDQAERYLLAARPAGRRGNFKEADFELRRFTGAQSTAEFLAEQLRIESCAEKE